MKTLEGKAAIVTGGGSGIGRAVAVAYAAEGARVIVGDLDEAGGQATVDIIKGQSGEAFFVRADASRLADNEMLVQRAVESFGGLHIACNNAGIGGPLALTGDYPPEGWEKVIAINLSGVFYGMRSQIRAMLATGGGAIVNMASILGQVGSRLSPAYVAAKHGVVGLTKTAALEYAARNIRINSVGPAYILTPLLTNNLPEDVLSSLVKFHPIGRLGQPEEVASLVVWLSSEQASFVTGAYYPVDGGYLAQ